MVALQTLDLFVRVQILPRKNCFHLGQKPAASRFFFKLNTELSQNFSRSLVEGPKIVRMLCALPVVCF